ncbi:hypothetical protein SAY87_013463 [Trapa incisa]|uniref:RING-type E3 ubiquitin transferase n=1 Tax=Trapa incisa TaxID=236973 RepID=A0AAN7KB42_9MYRT|nr:hypothetical protein SAY87_013463 [Trapa incisa]
MTRPPPTAFSAAASAAAPTYAVHSSNVESDFVIILAALLCALICSIGLLAVIRCTCLHRAADAYPTTSSSAISNKGIKKKVLESLPKFTYSSSSPATSDCKIAAECSICLVEFMDGNEIRVLPQCGHGFHAPCIDAWLVSHSSCPSCRKVLEVGLCRNCIDLPVAGGGGSGLCPRELDRGNTQTFLP